MPDFRAHVRARLPIPDIPGLQQADAIEELALDLEERYEAAIRRGSSPDEAWRQVTEAVDWSHLAHAFRESSGEFSGIERSEQQREGPRHMIQQGVFSSFLSDVRYAFRSLRKSPGFAAAAALTSALGIGSSVALFSVINAVILRPLPYAKPDRLVVIWTDDTKHQNHERLTAHAVYREWAQLASAFEGLAFCSGNTPVTAGAAGAPERVDAVFTSNMLFKLTGVSPLHGRTFSDEEERAGEGVVVLSYAAWRRLFGGAADVLGKNIAVDDRSAVVIGVMPPSFQLPSADIQFWLPLGRRQPRGVVFGRLRPAATVATAQNELSLVAERLAREHPELDRNPDHPGFRANVVPLHQQVTGRDVRRALWVLFAAVLFLLLIGCANVANLMIARATARRQELAIRTALGAGRGALIRQLVTESVVLACIGGSVGLLLAHLTLWALNGMAGIAVARMENVAVDSSVLIFGVGLSVLCGVGFGSYPAFSASRVDLNSTLRDGGRGQTGGAGSRFAQRLLIVGEFALTLTLLAAAGLMIRSLIQTERVPLGFRPDHALIFRVVLPDGFSKAQRATFHGQLRESLRALPGVTDSGAISNLFSARNAEATIQVAGQAPAAMAVGDEAMSEGLLPTIGSRLRAGRDFDARDNADAPRVAIVNERFVRSVLPAGQSAVGARIRFLDERNQGPDPWVTIVGVVEDIRRDGLEREPFPVVFSPFRQNPSRGADVVIRSANDPQSIMREVRRLVAAQQPTTPVYRVSTLENRLEAASQPRRLQTALLMFFAAAALLLASSGAYALLHYLVSQRTREIGLRVALGASAVHVVTYVLRDVLRLMAAGLLVGVAAALLLARAMQSMLFGVTAADPLAFTGAVILLSTVALAAGLAPAIRAARLNPVDALRD